VSERAALIRGVEDSVNDATTAIDCPNCEREISVKFGEIRKSPKVTCACGTIISVDGSQFDRDMRAVDAGEKAIDDALKGFPKTIGG